MTNEYVDDGRLPATRFAAAVRWYVVNRAVPALLYIFAGVVFLAVAPPWGDLRYIEFYGMLCMAIGALVFEAIKYRPWDDAA